MIWVLKSKHIHKDMPERQQGRDPNRRGAHQEIPLPEYRHATRFPDAPTSNTADEATRQVVYEEPCGLSLYRTALLPDSTWPILVLAQPPKNGSASAFCLYSAINF